MADKTKPIKRAGMMSLHPFNVTPKPSKKRRSWWMKYK